MIIINEMSRDFNEVEKYLMTVAPSIISLKDVEDNEKITVSGILTFTDKKDNGEETEILSVITPDKKVYSCQSATFKRSLADISNIMGDKEFTIIKVSGETKAGRSFINCILDIDSL